MLEKHLLNNNWDVAIIGSGIGGLLTGALLAKNHGLKVLVLEKHQKIGGCTHSFQRKKDYVFDVGVHYVSSVSENSFLRKVLTHATDSRLKWKALPPLLDYVYLPDAEFRLPVQVQEMLEMLCAEFPEEKKGLIQVFHQLRKVSAAHVLWQSSELLPAWLERPTRLWLRLTRRNMFRTVDEVLKKYIASARLRLLLVSRWQGLGLTPQEVSFGYFAGDFMHFSDGAWYPVGGGEMMAEELARTITDYGGQVVTNLLVEKILVENGRAIGVATQGQQIRANMVISGTGAWSTYHRFLAANESPYFDLVNKDDVANSYVMAFMVLNKSPRALGIDTANHWIFADDECSPFYPEDPDLRFFNGLWVGSPSLKRDSPYHTLEFATLAPVEPFQKWRDSRWRRRPEDYELYKKKLFESMMFIAESRFPGIREAVDYWEVSTPLTVGHFVTQAISGLGIPATTKRLTMPWARSTTPIEQLYLTGSDAFAWGISGALAGGVKTYKLIAQGPSRKNLGLGLGF